MGRAVAEERVIATVIDRIDVIGAPTTIALGLAARCAPRHAVREPDVETTGERTMGVSGVRAASRAFFAGLGIGASVIGEPAGLAMV